MTVSVSVSGAEPELDAGAAVAERQVHLEQTAEEPPHTDGFHFRSLNQLLVLELVLVLESAFEVEVELAGC